MASILIVSCRKGFWSATEFSSADEVRRIDLVTGTGTAVSPAEFRAVVQGQRVTVLVHGYNNEERDVLDAYGTIDREMRLLGFLGGAAAHYDALIGFAWPGGASGVSFPFARQRATESAPRLAALLALLRGAGAVTDLNTHSLGAHVTFEALRDSTPGVVRHAWNFASAVDNESIEDGERYHAASQRCQRFYVFHSKHDPVLRVWYRVGDFFDFDTALGYSGPEDPGAIITHSPHVRVINCKDVVQSHGGYRQTGQVWAYIAQELTQPSTAQFVTLTRTEAVLHAVFKAARGPMARAATSAATRTRGRRPGARPRTRSRTNKRARR